MTKGGSLPIFPCALTGLFLVLSYIGILHHEPWRDEYQAWLIARDAHSFSDLLGNLKYEGHPAVWYLFLWILSKFTHNPFVMQVLHIVISAAFVYLLNQYAPFSLVNKFLLTFGYYCFFEFNLISRSYGLGFLLVIIFLILYENRNKNYLWLSAVLFLLANSNVYGLMLSLCFSGILLLDYLRNTRTEEWVRVPALKPALSVLLIVGGWVISAIQIYPNSENTFPVNYAEAFDWARMKFAIWRIITSYFALPCLNGLHFWNTNLFDMVRDFPDGSRVADADKMYPVIPLAIVLIFSLYFLRKPLPLLLYVLGTGGLVCFFYYSRLTFSRYTSHLMVLLVASMWLAEYYPVETNYGSHLLAKMSAIGKVAGKHLFTLILIVGFAGGVVSYSQDLRYEFSSSSEMTTFLKQNHLERLPIIGVTDFVVSPAAAVLDRTIFYPQRNEEGSFVIWDNKRKETVPYGEIIQHMRDMAQRGVMRMLFITDTPLYLVDPITRESKSVEEGMISNELHIQLLNNVRPGIVADEKYCIYLVENRQP
jgi:hypothetical protein